MSFYKWFLKIGGIMKNNYGNYKHAQKVGIIIFCILIVLLNFSSLQSCGGGVVPYVPTQSGATGSSSGQFFLMEKGVATEMFDVKKLQPLFRNIVLSGNERKLNKKMGKIIEKNKKTREQDSTQSKNTKHNISSGDSTLPVLNLHRLH